MSMTNREAVEVLRRVTLTLRSARRDGKSTIARLWTEAILRAIAVLEEESRPVIIEGRIFKRRYCPTCHERIKRGGQFCHACGQAIREPRLSDYIQPTHIPPPPPRHYGAEAEIVIFDENVSRR